MTSHKADEKLAFSRWLINLSDEIDTPLNLLGATLEHLHADESDGLKKDQLKIALDQCAKFQNLMQNLHLAALEDNHMAMLRLSKVSPAGLTSEILDQFSEVARERNVELKYDGGEELETILDIERYSRILSTLISNAIQFSKNEGGVVHLSFHSNQAQNYWQISVQDNGIGIVPEKLAHVFDPLYDKDPIHLRLYQTTSMGLYLTSLFVKSLHGEITVESEKHLFTRFRVRFPIIASGEEIPFAHYNMVPADKVKAESATGLRIAGITDLRQEQHLSYSLNTVVILGGEKKFHKLFDEFWERAAVYQLENVSKALGHAVQLLPDLVVIQDGKYDGVPAGEFVKQLKSNRVTRLKPLIWLSNKEKHPQADLSLPLNTDEKEILDEVHHLLTRRKELMGEALPPSGPPKYQNSREAFLTQIERIVDAHLQGGNFDMDKLAELLHLDRSQVHRRVKSYTGLSTTEYIRNYKLKLAYEELLAGNGSVSEIAFKCGFNNLSYFTRSFRKVYNSSPSDILAQHK